MSGETREKEQRKQSKSLANRDLIKTGKVENANFYKINIS